MVRSLLVLLIAGWLAACSPALPDKDSLSTPAAPQETWMVKLTQSGGFAGVNRSITVTSAGELTAVDERAAHTVALQLPPEKIAVLEELVSSALIIEPGRMQSSCADCFIYDVDIRASSAGFTAHVDDVTLPDSDLRPLVQALQDLMDQALSMP